MVGRGVLGMAFWIDPARSSLFALVVHATLLMMATYLIVRGQIHNTSSCH